MPGIMDDTTIAAAFATAVSAYADRPFLAVPANPDRPYLPSGFEMSYGEAGRRVEALADLYRQAGYGVGHRVATLLENRPEHVLHTLALNTIGVCCVPINPDYRAAEIAYLMAMKSRRVPGTQRSAALPGCARPKIASTIRCRSIMRMPASCR